MKSCEFIATIPKGENIQRYLSDSKINVDCYNSNVLLQNINGYTYFDYSLSHLESAINLKARHVAFFGCIAYCEKKIAVRENDFARPKFKILESINF